jgi:hypothetical protein
VLWIVPSIPESRLESRGLFLMGRSRPGEKSTRRREFSEQEPRRAGISRAEIILHLADFGWGFNTR